MEEIKTVLLLLTIVYGLAFGLRNWVVRITTWITGKTLNQSELGKFLDYCFLIAILYFWYIQPDILSNLLKGQ